MLHHKKMRYIDACERCAYEMRTTLNIDSDLQETVVEATGEKNKSKVVHAALREYIRRKHVQELIHYWRKNPMSDEGYREYLENKRRQLAADESRRVFLDSLRYGTP